MSCPGSSLKNRVHRKRQNKAHFAGNIGDIAKECNAVLAFSVRSLRASHTKRLAALRFLPRTTAIAGESRLARHFV